jgi:hypothetical protein
MTFVVQSAPNGLAVDTNWEVTPATLKSLAAARPVVQGAPAQPVLGVAIYVSLHEPESVSDATVQKLADITQAGFGCWLVQHVLMPGWTASAQLGADLGGAACANAQKIGYLPGAHVFLDLEGCKSEGLPVIEFINAWAAQMTVVYPPGLYRGYSSGLTSAQAYGALPTVHGYWKAPGPWDVDVRGTFIEQLYPEVTIGGVTYDYDILGADKLGGRLQWIIDMAAVTARFGTA